AFLIAQRVAELPRSAGRAARFCFEHREQAPGEPAMCGAGADRAMEQHGDRRSPVDERPPDQLRLGQLERLLDPLSRGAPFSVELVRDRAPDCAPDTVFGRARVVAVAAQSESGHGTKFPSPEASRTMERTCVFRYG